MQKKISRYVTEEYEDSTLQHFLRAGMGLTRREISRAKFLPGGICVDGEQKKVTARVKKGQLVEVQTENGNKSSAQLSASREPLEVLYEDADVIIVNKPAGIQTHPAGRRTFEADTLASRLMYYLGGKGEEGVIRIVGRLDKDTSGVVLAAKNRMAAGRLTVQREQGALKKIYLAVTEGIPEPESGEIRVPLAPDPEDKTRMITDPDGKSAGTHYRVRKKGKNRALVELWLETGRTHQIRVHLKEKGCPLAGDPLYGTGGKESGIGRTALHAAALTFRQPFTGEVIRVGAPMPKDIARLVEAMVK